MARNSYKIYLSGAIGCYEKSGSDYYKTWRKDVDDMFAASIDDCFDPTKFYSYNDSSYTEKEVMRYDLKQLKNSDIVLVNLDSIDMSIGTAQEILYAYLLNIPIIGFIEDEESTYIHPWVKEEVDKIFVGENSKDEAVDYIKTYYGE